MSEKGTLGMIMVKASSAEVGEKISKQIDEHFMNSSYATRSGPESMVAVEMAGEIADVELIVNSILLSVFLLFYWSHQIRLPNRSEKEQVI